MKEYVPKRVEVGPQEICTHRDVAQLIVKLPYIAAVALAEAMHGDVDKMIEGAFNIIDAKLTDE